MSLTHLFSVLSLLACSTSNEVEPNSTNAQAEPSSEVPPPPPDLNTTATETSGARSFVPTAKCYAEAKTSGEPCVVELSDPDVIFSGTVEGQMFGQYVAIGDFSGDGVPDFIGSSANEVSTEVVPGPLSGEHRVPDPLESPWELVFENSAGRMVRMVQNTVGADFTGDGVPNLVSGVYAYDSPIQPDSELEKMEIAEFECLVQAIPDVTGDGVRDIYERCPIDHYVHSGADVAAGGGRLFGLRVEQSDLGEVFTVIPDMNGDGFDELLLTYTNPWLSAERDYGVILAGRNTPLPRKSILDREPPLLSVLSSPYIGGVAGGDYNGDGVGDLAVSVANNCRVYFGPFPMEWSPMSESPNPAYFEVVDELALGSSVANPGDLDGDGSDELMCAFATEEQPFEVHIMDTAAVFGSYTLQERSIWKLTTTTALHASLQASHSMQIVDYTGDGVNDLVLIAPSGPPIGAGEVVMVDGTRF